MRVQVRALDVTVTDCYVSVLSLDSSFTRVDCAEVRV